jgi:hypothetical protein
VATIVQHDLHSVRSGAKVFVGFPHNQEASFHRVEGDKVKITWPDGSAGLVELSLVSLRPPTERFQPIGRTAGKKKRH